MNLIFCFTVLISFVCAMATGSMESFSLGFLTDAQGAVELCFSLLGSFCFWGGIMKVAENANIVDILAKIIAPVTGLLFKGLGCKGNAMKAIILNFSANILGLGNAATPFGIKAVEEIKREEKSGDSATDNMIMFVVINTASLTLIPSTVIMMRLNAGSAAPMEIITAVWAASAVSLLSGILTAKLFSLFGGDKNKKL
ncbi:MAG: nucleoside recognition domain-containing protein [Oscillospiraceae bacterium]